MEPVSTLMLAASISLGAAATQRPKWEDRIAPSTLPNSLVIPPIERRAPILGSVAQKNVPAPQTQKEKLFAQLLAFIPVGTENPDLEPVSKLEHILVANQFLRKLPGSIPLPTLMRNDDGQIGMFWDNDDAYIDLDVESESTFSLYIRVRSTNQKQLIENINVDALDADWFSAHFETVAAPHVHA